VRVRYDYTLPLTAKVADAKNAMKEYGIGGIPIIDEEHRLKGIVTNRDLRFEKTMQDLLLR
jgi:IMP dehydrogenase